MLAAAAEYGVGMEINALGIRKQSAQSASNPYPQYPWLPFWEIATDYDVQVIVNSDAHRPEDLQHMDVEALGNRDIA